jgi:hypothetical protein
MTDILLITCILLLLSLTLLTIGMWFNLNTIEKKVEQPSISRPNVVPQNSTLLNKGKVLKFQSKPFYKSVIKRSKKLKKEDKNGPN